MLRYEFLRKNVQKLYGITNRRNIMYQEAKSDDWLNRLQSQDSNERDEMMEGTNFELVGDFMEAFGQDVETQPTWPDFNTRELRVDLIQEEVDELVEAIANKDMVEIADALTDILYVVYGAGHTFGIDLDECFTEVHASNMSKLGEDGTINYDENGKVLKSPGFFPPDLESILNQ